MANSRTTTRNIQNMLGVSYSASKEEVLKYTHMCMCMRAHTHTHTHTPIDGGMVIGHSSQLTDRVTQWPKLGQSEQGKLKWYYKNKVDI